LNTPHDNKNKNEGIGGGWTRAQIFKIMTDSRVGTYGCAALGLYTTTKVQLLAALGESCWNLNIPTHTSDGLVISQGAGPAMVVAHTLARVTAPYLIRNFEYVDDEQGPKSSFYAFMVQAKHLVSKPRTLAAISFGWMTAAVLFGPIVAILLIVLVLSFAHAAGRYGNHILGGVMGDFLGAVICLCELLILATILLVHDQQSKHDYLTSWGKFSGAVLEIMPGTESNSAETTLQGLQANIIPAILQDIIEDKRAVALTRFLAVYGCMKVWSVFVSHYNVSVKAVTLSSETSSNGTNVTSNKVNTSALETATNDTSPKGETSRILSLPASTFRERYDAVQAYMDVLAKPVGSLGLLEAWAARLAALQRSLQPDAERVACLIFAGDHGVAASPEEGGEGCSAYPQAVTRSVLVGLHRGVAGASVLAKANDVQLRVVDVGVILGNDDPFRLSQYVVSSPNKLQGGTRNFCLEPAMSAEECELCMKTGRESLVQYVEETSASVVVLGEVGIGNTTSSSALIAALTGESTTVLCGGGAFATRELSEALVSKKIAIVDKALTKHYGSKRNASNTIQAAGALAKLGGAEIAAMVGAFLEASSLDLPVLVDGFIATAAALVAVSISPNVSRVLFFASHSAEPGHKAAIKKIQAIAREYNIPVDEGPALSMHLRMGEATAALLAVPILRSSAEIVAGMATIQDILS
jgi:nicotinate-nucleotide--dimethylbenzimidazole phosphoribosyltransferase